MVTALAKSIAKPRARELIPIYTKRHSLGVQPLNFRTDRGFKFGRGKTKIGFKFLNQVVADTVAIDSVQTAVVRVLIPVLFLGSVIIWTFSDQFQSFSII